jgi:hypothetical protein
VFKLFDFELADYKISRGKQEYNKDTVAVWRSGHRISLKNRRPGFESRLGVGFLGKFGNDVWKIVLICIVCVIYL